MSVGFQHPNAKVYVRDGFKFLEEQKNQFDVIITDSSDPEGPAEVLFQKPYFELLYGALREGGVISTQGCSSPLRPLLVSFALCFHSLPLRFGLRRYPDFYSAFQVTLRPIPLSTSISFTIFFYKESNFPPNYRPG